MKRNAPAHCVAGFHPIVTDELLNRMVIRAATSVSETQTGSHWPMIHVIRASDSPALVSICNVNNVQYFMTELHTVGEANIRSKFGRNCQTKLGEGD